MKVSSLDITFHRGDAMYRINDRSSAIKRVQEYLRSVGNKNIFVAPTGIYDENTKANLEMLKDEIELQEYKLPITLEAIKRMTEKI